MVATDLTYAGAAEQARMIADGDVTAREVVEATLQRIERVNPALNAYRVVFGERALAEADQADARVRGGDRRPLLGVPVAVKDDVDVAGEVTAWGTAAHGPAPARDAEVVARLRAAGAVIVGKTHVPEMTIWPFTETLTFGATRNPWNLDRTPGGSSGGTGVAVAAGLAGVGLGSDGAGSIRIPSAFCGLFGIKPQRDRVPLSPHDNAWHGLSVNGPLARSVSDAALFLDATADDPPAAGFLGAARTPPGRLRIAISTKFPPGVIAKLSDSSRRAFDDAAELLRSLGHEVVQHDPDYPRDAALNLTGRYLRGIHDDVAEAMPHPERLEPRTRGMVRLGRLGRLWPASRITKLRAGEAAMADRINSLFADHDVLLTPGPTHAPWRIGTFHGRGALRTLNAVASRVPYYGLFNATGQPAASVPMGFDGDGLPTAVQLVGRPRDEATLLSLAGQMEAERPWAGRRPALATDGAA